MPFDKTILKKKVFGLPVPVVALGAGVVGVILYRKFGAGKAAADTSNPDATATPSDYSQGSAGSGGGAGDYSGGTGDSGSIYDQGLGSQGDYVSSGAGFGGAMVPATNAGGIFGTQPFTAVGTWHPTWRSTWRPTWRPQTSGRPRAIHPTVIYKTVVNAPPKYNRPPAKVYSDHKIQTTRPKRGKTTAPIIRR